MGSNKICMLISLLLVSLAVAQPASPLQPVKALQPLGLEPSSVEADVSEYDDVDEVAEDREESEETYASDFPYGQPLEDYNTEGRETRATSRQGRAHIKIVHKWAGNPRNYAKKYRTWMPAKEWIKPTKSKKGPKRLGPPSRRKPGRRRESAPPNRRRKIKPFRGNHLQRPSPPPEPDYDYLSEEEYFPEETKRNEFGPNPERRPPPNKKQGMRRKPGNAKGERYRPTEDYPSVSYSNFIQHPASTSSSFDYAEFIEDDPVPVPQKERRRKKKRRKGDRKRVRDRGEDQFGANSESIEEANLHYEKYPPYPEEPPLRRPIRHPQSPTLPTPIYGDGYLGPQGNINRAPQNVNINRGTVAPGLGRFRTDQNSGAAQTFASQAYEPNNYNNFGVSNNHPQPEIITQQNYNQFVNQDFGNNGQRNQFGGHHNQAAVNPTTFSNHGVNNFNRPVNYNQNFANRPTPPQQITNAHTLQNVIPTNRGNEYSSKYKSSSFFDNTETFQDFNQNVNYNQQHVKQRPSFVPSTEYQEPAVDAENEFITRHLDLYSNGMSGVPVQGDGRHETRNKDYDIGYGEIQYDESHRT